MNEPNWTIYAFSFCECKQKKKDFLIYNQLTLSYVVCQNIHLFLLPRIFFVLFSICLFVSWLFVLSLFSVVNLLMSKPTMLSLNQHIHTHNFFKHNETRANTLKHISHIRNQFYVPFWSHTRQQYSYSVSYLHIFIFVANNPTFWHELDQTKWFSFSWSSTIYNLQQMTRIVFFFFC